MLPFTPRHSLRAPVHAQTHPHTLSRPFPPFQAFPPRGISGFLILPASPAPRNLHWVDIDSVSCSMMFSPPIACFSLSIRCPGSLSGALPSSLFLPQFLLPLTANRSPKKMLTHRQARPVLPSSGQGGRSPGRILRGVPAVASAELTHSPTHPMVGVSWGSAGAAPGSGCQRAMPTTCSESQAGFPIYCADLKGSEAASSVERVSLEPSPQRPGDAILRNLLKNSLCLEMP